MNNEWISVKDRLPSNDGKYLTFAFLERIDGTPYNPMYQVVSFANNLEAVSDFDFNFNGKKYSGFYDYDSEYGHFELDYITHWMELPELPKEYKECEKNKNNYTPHKPTLEEIEDFFYQR